MDRHRRLGNVVGDLDVSGYAGESAAYLGEAEVRPMNPTSAWPGSMRQTPAAGSSTPLIVRVGAVMATFLPKGFMCVRTHYRMCAWARNC